MTIICLQEHFLKLPFYFGLIISEILDMGFAADINWTSSGNNREALTLGRQLQNIDLIGLPEVKLLL